jgi:EIX receptor 1/2
MNSNRLTILSLANNNFSGNISTSRRLLNQLAILQLRNNNFTGQLSLSMMNFTNPELEFLDLSKNKLSGKVPFWIGTHLTDLVVLSLRNNEFSGSIPPQICHLRYAQVLDLSHNYLTGRIPNCINNFTSLVDKETINDVHLWIMNSGVHGYRYANVGVQWKGVPSEYERTLEYLKLIDISSNRLVGEIPREFASLKALISLNLSRNNLTGDILPKIGEMETLENLDLSRNHLSGKIPSGLASLTFLSALDLSNNNFEGEIPKSTQLQSFDPTKYAGNEHLCGLPLPNKCGGEHSLPTANDDKDESNKDGDDNFPKFWLYVSAALGFGTGFWGFIGPIMLRRTWRHSYYKLLGNVADWIYIRTILQMTRLQRKFTANRSNLI